MVMNDKDRQLLDELTSELAAAEADKAIKRPESADERAALDQHQAKTGALLERLRKDAFDELRGSRRATARRTLPQRILDMTRDAVLDQLRKLEARAPSELQAAYRQLAILETDELRVLLDDVEHALAE